MSVRAKMVCQSKESKEEGGHVVILHPVVSGSKENEDFYKWTPGGYCRLETINDVAAAQFDVDGEYYVTFEKAG